jgi:DNA-binding CsgD family transcriptional regulator/PAS domain-containing protein
LSFGDRLLGVVEAIYGSALDPAHWPDALERVAELLSSQHAHFFIADSRTMIPTLAAVGRSMPESLLREFHAYYQALDPRTEAGLRLPAGVFYPDFTLCDPVAFERSEFYNDFYRRCGSRWMAGAMLERTEHHTTGFAIVRTPHQGPFEPRDLRLLELLRPHLSQAARMHRRLVGQARQLAIDVAAFDRLAVGIVLLDPCGRVVRWNRAAQEIFSAGDGLHLGWKGFEASSRRADSALQKALAAATSVDPLPPQPAALAIERPSLERPYEVLIAPLFAETSPSFPSEAGILVLITAPGSASELPAQLLARLHGLTPAEARVAVALAAGRSLAEIAEASGYTREAARGHLKQIFQKTGTHRQAELVALLRDGALAYARDDESV